MSRNGAHPREVKPDPKEKPEWLLMVHMLASAPNLQQPLGLDLEELSRPLKDLPAQVMTAGGARPVVDVWVQVDAPTGVSRRFRLTPEKTEVHGVFPTQPSTTLRDFVNDVCKDVDPNAPEQTRTRTALVVWGHASGSGRGMGRSYMSVGNSVGSPRCELPREAQLAQRQLVGRHIAGRRAGGAIVKSSGPPSRGAEVAQAGSVWTQLASLETKLNVVGFDACYMACVEVVYQLIGNVDYVLAPQPGIGLEGWHYDLFLDQIIAGKMVGVEPYRERKCLEPRDLGLRVVSQVGLTATSPQALSLVDVAAIGGLATRIKVLTGALADAYDAAYRESQMRRLIHEAFDDAAWAGVRQFLDLGDLCRVLASRIPDRRVRTAALAVLGGMTPGTAVDADTRVPFKEDVPALKDLEVAKQIQAAMLELADRRSRGPNHDKLAQREGKIGRIEFENGGPLVDHLSVLDIPLSGLSIFCPWPRDTDVLVNNVDVDQREYVGERAGKGLTAFVSNGDYQGLDFAVHTGWGDFVFQPQRLRDVEQRWMRNQLSMSSATTAVLEYGHYNGYRPDNPKPAGRQDSKPQPRNDSKPAGRQDDSKPAGRDDTSKPAKRSDIWAV